MSSYWKACLVSALTHGLGLVLFVVANDIAHHLYLLWNGGFGSRGIAPGAVFYLVLLLFSVANLLAVFIPVRKVKYGISVVFSRYGCAAFAAAPSSRLVLCCIGMACDCCLYVCVVLVG